MAQNNQELATEFVGKYEHTNFRHAVDVIEVLKDLAAANVRLSVDTAQLNSEMRANYRYRAARSQEFLDDRAPSLGEDASALALCLDSVPDQRIRSWQLQLPDGRIYVVFELLTEARIAGCLSSFDWRNHHPD